MSHINFHLSRTVQAALVAPLTFRTHSWYGGGFSARWREEVVTARLVCLVCEGWKSGMVVKGRDSLVDPAQAVDTGVGIAFRSQIQLTTYHISTSTYPWTQWDRCRIVRYGVLCAYQDLMFGFDNHMFPAPIYLNPAVLQAITPLIQRENRPKHSGSNLRRLRPKV